MNPEIAAEKWTDKELARLEKRISEQYTKAANELSDKAFEYMLKYKPRWEKEHLAMLTTSLSKDEVEKKWVDLYGSPKGFERWYKTANNAYGSTPREADAAFKRWEQAQLGRGKHWEDLADQMASRVAQAAQISAGYINGVLPNVFIANSNGVAELATKSAMEQGVAGIRFDLVDEYAVREMMKSASEVRPYKPVVISMDETKQWSKNKMQNALLQGILQGDDIGSIAKRFETAVGMSRKAAIRNARTAVTGAQNRGKQSRFEDLSSKGCEVTKMWSATDDSRTRPEHSQAEADYGDEGTAIPYNEPFEVGGEPLMYPADPDGSPWNICNCRCSMRTGEIKFKSILSDKERKAAKIKIVEEPNHKTETAQKPAAKKTAFSESKTIASLKRTVEYNEVMELAQEETFDEIVAAIAGGDLTEGSCASVALAYIGRECGFDVLDFRNGQSRVWFSSKLNKQEMFSELGATSHVTQSFKSNLANGKKALKEASAGEYYLSVGRHAAIVRKTDDGQLQYLELQSSYKNGWVDFSSDIGSTLKDRFGCSSASSWYNAAILTETGQMKDKEGFAEVLGYINTSSSNQKKGKNGSIK